MAKKLSQVSLEKFVTKFNRKPSRHNGKKVRFGWVRRKGGQ